MKHPVYQRTSSDKIQDAIMLAAGIVVMLVFVGVPLLNILGISLGDIVSIFR